MHTNARVCVRPYIGHALPFMHMETIDKDEQEALHKLTVLN